MARPPGHEKGGRFVEKEASNPADRMTAGIRHRNRRRVKKRGNEKKEPRGSLPERTT